MYPTLVIRGTGLYELWKQGLYRNYPPDKVHRAGPHRPPCHPNPLLRRAPALGTRCGCLRPQAPLSGGAYLLSADAFSVPHRCGALERQ